MPHLSEFNDSESEGQELIQSRQAESFLKSLQEPVKLVAKKDRSRLQTITIVTDAIFPWWSVTYPYTQTFPIDRKVKMIEFNVPDMISKVTSKIKGMEPEELFLKAMHLNWEPYIAQGMSGWSTVVLCDFRSKQDKNIRKGGYAFPVSRPSGKLSIYPGYPVHLKDPNLSKVFRLMIFTTGLDLMDDSIYGKIVMKAEFTIGNSLRSLKETSDAMTLVTTERAMAFANKEMGPMSELSEGIEIKHILESFSAFEQEKNPRKPSLMNLEEADNIMMRSNSSISSFTASNRSFGNRSLDGRRGNAFYGDLKRYASFGGTNPHEESLSPFYVGNTSGNSDNEEVAKSLEEERKKEKEAQLSELLKWKERESFEIRRSLRMSHLKDTLLIEEKRRELEEREKKLKEAEEVFGKLKEKVDGEVFEKSDKSLSPARKSTGSVMMPKGHGKASNKKQEEFGSSSEVKKEEVYISRPESVIDGEMFPNIVKATLHYQ